MKPAAIPPPEEPEPPSPFPPPEPEDPHEFLRKHGREVNYKPRAFKSAKAAMEYILRTGFVELEKDR
jgi:hypothetical protein